MIGHFEEHNNVMPEIYSKPGMRELAIRVKREASRLIPGKLDVCHRCHGVLYGEQWLEGEKKSYGLV